MKLSNVGFNWLYGFEKKNQLLDRICTNQILMSPGWVLGLHPQNTALRNQQVKYHLQKSSPTKNPTNSSNVRFLFPYFRFTPFRRVCETRNLPPPPLSKRNDGWGGKECWGGLCSGERFILLPLTAPSDFELQSGYPCIGLSGLATRPPPLSERNEG